MRKHKTTRRIFAALLSLLLCASMLCGPAALALESDRPEADPRFSAVTEAAEENNTAASDLTTSDPASESENGGADDPASDGTSTVDKEIIPAAKPGDTKDNTASGGTSVVDGANTVDGAAAPDSDPIDSPETTALQAFLAAVENLDRNAILTTANDWGLANRAWQQAPEDPALKAALDAAVQASDETAAAVYAAEDLFYELSEEEQATDAAQATFSSLMALVLAMHTAMESPTDPDTGKDTGDDPTAPGTGTEPPTDAEIAEVLYGDLPDAPTGSYIGSLGLPVAVGETRIGFARWDTELADARARMDAAALYADGLTLTQPLQAGQGYAVVPLLAEVEYPENGSRLQILLPEGVTLLSQDGSGAVASAEEAARVLHMEFQETSAAVQGVAVQATEDFTARLLYTAPNGQSMEKTLTVQIDRENTVADSPALYSLRASTFDVRPTPAATTGKVTAVQKINGVWCLWFNGEPAYCCTHDAHAGVTGCPTYTYSRTSIVEAWQYTPGDHPGNQLRIWGGLGQITLGLRGEDAATFSAQSADEFYDARQLWILQHYPDSRAARIWRGAEQPDISTYAAESDYYCCATCSATSL